MTSTVLRILVASFAFLAFLMVRNDPTKPAAAVRNVAVMCLFLMVVLLALR
jgi:hypothetical protein